MEVDNKWMSDDQASYFVTVCEGVMSVNDEHFMFRDQDKKRSMIRRLGAAIDTGRKLNSEIVNDEFYNLLATWMAGATHATGKPDGVLYFVAFAAGAAVALCAMAVLS